MWKKHLHKHNDYLLFSLSLFDGSFDGSCFCLAVRWSNFGSILFNTGNKSSNHDVSVYLGQIILPRFFVLYKVEYKLVLFFLKKKKVTTQHFKNLHEKFVKLNKVSYFIQLSFEFRKKRNLFFSNWLLGCQVDSDDVCIKPDLHLMNLLFWR